MKRFFIELNMHDNCRDVIDGIGMMNFWNVKTHINWMIETDDWINFVINRAVTDPRDGKRVALKKLPNVFQSLVSARRVCRELRMLCFFKHDNVLSAQDILQPPHIDFFQEM